jgi:hypothetical protein
LQQQKIDSQQKISICSFALFDKQLSYLQDNLMSSLDLRDLGGADLYEVLLFLRQVWWQRAPLIHRDAPSHPMWKMAFFLEARSNGTWDRWLDVTLQWHQEINGLMNALNTPVGAMANLLPPHLLVIQMLEPVKVQASRTIVYVIA